MKSTQRIEKALDLLQEQVEDTNLDPKQRAASAKTILTYFKQGSVKYESTAKTKQSTAAEAAAKFRRVK